MKNEIKSGKVILDEFFKDIKNIENLEQATIDKIIKLYEEEKLTAKNLTNALSILRGSSGDGKN